MKFIRPTAITDARLTSSSVPETDFAAWNAATAYIVGDQVIRTATHSIYKRAVAGTTATAPESDTINWSRVGPTNRWAMFDGKVGTVSTAADSITVVLAPGRLNSLAILEADCSTATVTLDAGGSTVYSASFDMDSGNTVGNWYEYYYEPVYQQTELLITDLLDAALLDIPAYGEGVLTVTLSRPGGTVSCGMLVVGLVTEVGKTQYGAEVSIRDFSIKDPDPFAATPLLEREYTKKLNATVAVRDEDVDSVTKTVSRYRATNVVWIGSTEYGCTVIYGFLADWKMAIPSKVSSLFTAQIEGMT